MVSQDMESVCGEIKQKLINKGASVIGFADLSVVEEDKRNGYPYGIVIGVALDPDVIAGIKNGPTKEYYDLYHSVNQKLDELDNYAAEFLKELGFNAEPQVTTTVTYDKESFRSPLPHKTVATRGGIGWIGKCALLVTEDYGSAIRISTVLTDAPLIADIPIDNSKCGACSNCTDICPANAVKGETWDITKDRNELYDAHACREVARKRCKERINYEMTLCGLCIYSCPWTKQYIRNSITTITGGLEFLDMLEPLWKQLRSHHGSVAKYFAKKLMERSYAERTNDFMIKAPNHKFKVDVLVIGPNKRPIGFCISSVSDTGIGEIESLFVEENFRGLNLGDELMKNALKWMDDAGVSKKRISVVVGNDNVLTFYEKYGFKPRSYILEQLDN